MSLLNTVYERLAGNVKLGGLLAKHNLSMNKPAIYEQWAAPDTAKPYICMTYFFGDSYHWARSETAINIDVFTAGDTVTAEAIRNQVIKLLDQATLKGQDGEESDVRCFLSNDSIIIEDNPKICHWNIEIMALFWRNELIDYINGFSEE
jgi:hypothetical protein